MYICIYVYVLYMHMFIYVLYMDTLRVCVRLLGINLQHYYWLDLEQSHLPSPVESSMTYLLITQLFFLPLWSNVV